MKNQTFGMELEMSGVTRKRAAEIIANYFGTEASYEGGTYDTYVAYDRNGRKWKCMYDSSIVSGRHDTKCEMVTPILTYDEDIEDLQEIVRLLRKTKAVSSASKRCGIHIHVGADKHTVQSLKNLVNYMSSYQDVIYKALKIAYERESYCKKLESILIDKFNERGMNSIDKCESAWYGKGREHGKYNHYDGTRYHGLNLHAVFSKGTVEFRLFNGTLHAGEIRSYILFCLAVNHYAIEKRCIRREKKQSYNDKYTMGAMLGQIGLAGDEYKVVREHLMKNLDGSLSPEGRRA